METTDEIGAVDAFDALVTREAWTMEDHKELLRLLFDQTNAPRKCREVLGALEREHPEPMGTAALKIGIARYMLCRFRDALDVLVRGTDNNDRRYFQGLSHKYLREYDMAIEEFERAKDRGADSVDMDLEIAEARALSGDLATARKVLKRLESKQQQNPQFHYVCGLVDELEGLGQQAVEKYEAARSLDETHVGATFRLAYYYDLHGEEEQAIDLYKQCISRPPVHANALLNLAVLYDDVGDYDTAISYLKRILRTNPNHPRARLFLKDAEASKTMYYDEEQARRLARRNAVLDIPITDFELSVRARNCLKKMNIRSLGDLVNTTETELLGYKNFGETSLKEIKEMMSTKNLHLGQALEEGIELQEIPLLGDPAKVENEGVLGIPIEQIEFSVRARRALESLNMKTLGELAGKTESELLGCRNFGQTSLNEIRQRLAEYGLQLGEPS